MFFKYCTVNIANFKLSWSVGTVLQFKNTVSTFAVFATEGVCYHCYLVRKQSLRRKLLFFVDY